MPSLFANKYRTQSTRLPERDYSSGGGYFCTICVDKKECLLGEIIDDEIRLSEIGKIVEECRLDIPDHFPNVELDEFVIMPNHIHGILSLHEKNNDMFVETTYRASHINNLASQKNETSHGLSLRPKYNKNSLSSIINQFKGSVTRQSKKLSISFPRQSKFYEHIIRNNQDLQRIQEYIQNNPYKRKNDEYYVS